LSHGFNRHTLLTAAESHLPAQAELVATHQQPESRFLRGRNDEQ
jgi:hypothetical protein